MVTNEYIAWAQRLHSAILAIILVGVLILVVHVKKGNEPIELPPNTYQVSFTITLKEEDAGTTMSELYEFIGYYIEENAGINPSNQLLELGMFELNVRNFKIEK